MSKTFERRDWSMAEWRPSRLRLDEDLYMPHQRVSFYEEMALVFALLALGAAVVFLI